MQTRLGLCILTNTCSSSILGKRLCALKYKMFRYFDPKWIVRDGEEGDGADLEGVGLELRTEE